jgi:bisphosphoglycerate-dependent phosphoglycerate mutase
LNKQNKLEKDSQNKVDLILASTHEKANKTAKIIHEIVTKHQNAEIPFQETDLLGERGIGKLIGQSHMEVLFTA